MWRLSRWGLQQGSCRDLSWLGLSARFGGKGREGVRWLWLGWLTPSLPPSLAGWLAQGSGWKPTMAAAPASDWEDGRFFMEDLIQQGQGMRGGGLRTQSEGPTGGRQAARQEELGLPQGAGRGSERGAPDFAASQGPALWDGGPRITPRLGRGVEGISLHSTGCPLVTPSEKEPPSGLAVVEWGGGGAGLQALL